MSCAVVSLAQVVSETEHPIPFPFEMLVVLCCVLDSCALSNSVFAVDCPFPGRHAGSRGRCSKNVGWLDGLMLGQARFGSRHSLSVQCSRGRQWVWVCPGYIYISRAICISTKGTFVQRN